MLENQLDNISSAWNKAHRDISYEMNVAYEKETRYERKACLE